ATDKSMARSALGRRRRSLAFATAAIIALVVVVVVGVRALGSTDDRVDVRTNGSGETASVRKSACSALRSASAEIDASGRVSPAPTATAARQLAGAVSRLPDAPWPKDVRAALATIESTYREVSTAASANGTAVTPQLLAGKAVIFGASATHLHNYVAREC